MCVNNLPKVATQWNSGATRDSNCGRRVLIPSALTTTPPSHSFCVCVCKYNVPVLITVCYVCTANVVSISGVSSAMDCICCCWCGRVWATDASCWGYNVADISIYVAACLCANPASINAALPRCTCPIHHGLTSRWQQGSVRCLLTGWLGFSPISFDYLA